MAARDIAANACDALSPAADFFLAGADGGIAALLS